MNIKVFLSSKILEFLLGLGIPNLPGHIVSVDIRVLKKNFIRLRAFNKKNIRILDYSQIDPQNTLPSYSEDCNFLKNAYNDEIEQN